MRRKPDGEQHRPRRRREPRRHNRSTTRSTGCQGSERTNTLLDLAKKDGTLSLYTSNTDMDDVVKAFEDKYGLKVETYRANSETVLQRVLQEASANYQGADLIETNAGELNAMQQRQLLYPYQGELRDKVRPEGRKDGWTADRFNAFVIGWNTSKVPAGTEPQSLKDLAEPQWKGRVGLEIGDVDWFAAMYNYYKSQGSSDDEVMSFFHQLAANSKIAKGHTVMGELLSAGQFDVAASIYSHTVDNAAEKGAPVSWRKNGKPVEPVVLRPNGAGLMKSAKHPAAAMLFLDFLLTDGQKAIAGREPDRSDSHGPGSAGRRPDGLGSRGGAAQQPAEVERHVQEA